MNKEIIDVLNNGNLAILPTDTVYGIIADATNEEAAKKVFEAKKREKKPLIVMVSSIEMLKEYVSEINDLEEKLINKYWPNTLTILFKKNNNISNIVTADSPYVGIRMPNNKMLLDIMNDMNRPLISTSANISNEKVITNTKLIDPELKKYITYIYDAGELSDVASTLIKVDNNKIIFLREGILSNQIKKDFKSYCD